MSDPSRRSLVSLVVPVYNDPEGVADTLDSLVAQTHDDHEVLVVDNGSTDDTRDVICEYAAEYEHVTLLVEDEVQGSYAARNEGLEHASGDVIAFLDADETVEPDWLETAIDAMQERDVDYLGCAVELALPEDTPVGRYNARTGFPVERYLREENYAPTCALLVRSAVFEDVGLFDSRLVSGGDLEFGQRVAAAEYRQGYAPDAVVTHPARASLRSLAKKNVRVGRGFCQKQRYYPNRYGVPGVPPSPGGSEGDGSAVGPDDLPMRVAFLVLSVAMLACRGFGYYLEFFIDS